MLYLKSMAALSPPWLMYSHKSWWSLPKLMTQSFSWKNPGFPVAFRMVSSCFLLENLGSQGPLPLKPNAGDVNLPYDATPKWRARVCVKSPAIYGWTAGGLDTVFFIGAIIYGKLMGLLVKSPAIELAELLLVFNSEFIHLDWTPPFFKWTAHHLWTIPFGIVLGYYKPSFFTVYCIGHYQYLSLTVIGSCSTMFNHQLHNYQRTIIQPLFKYHLTATWFLYHLTRSSTLSASFYHQPLFSHHT